MAIYFSKKRMGYRYDFIMNGTRYTSSYHETKKEAIRAENIRKEELLDHNTGSYYRTNKNLLLELELRWIGLNCSEISKAIV